MAVKNAMELSLLLWRGGAEPSLSLLSGSLSQWCCHCRWTAVVLSLSLVLWRCHYHCTLSLSQRCRFRCCSGNFAVGTCRCRMM